MENLQKFIANPFAYLAFVMLGAIGYLFYDNSQLHERITKHLKEQLAEQKENQSMLLRVVADNTATLKKIDERFLYKITKK